MMTVGIKSLFRLLASILDLNNLFVMPLVLKIFLQSGESCRYL